VLENLIALFMLSSVLNSEKAIEVNIQVVEALRMIKEAERHDEKVRTLEKPVTSQVWEYLEEQIELLVNSKVRTLKTLIVPNEKAPEGANDDNGAGDGALLELFCTKEAIILYNEVIKYKNMNNYENFEKYS